MINTRPLVTDADYRQWEAERREAEPLPSFTLTAPNVDGSTGEILYRSPMAIMRARILDRLREKYEGYTIYTENTTAFFDFIDFPHPLYFGATSWKAPTTKQKWIDQSQAINDIGLDFPATAPDIARAYVGLKFPNRRAKMHKDQYEACVKAQYCPPAYADPGAIYDGCVYFDLTSAYWQIVRAVGWDVEYMPGEYLGGGEDMTDFPFRFQKLTRNCLISIGMGGLINFWTGKEIQWLKPGNQFINKVLWRLTCDVLNGVAYDCIRAGARYCCVDGYICSGTHSRAVAEAIAEWGLNFGVRFHGDYGVVRGLGSYAVGDYQSMPYRQSIRNGSVNRVYDPAPENRSDWLRWRFRALVEKANQDWLFYQGVEGYDD